MKKKVRILHLCGLILFACSAVNFCFASAGITENRADKITIIGTGDLQGHMDAVRQTIRLTNSGKKIRISGGISRIATLISQVRKESDNPVIVLSSGDDLMGQYFHRFYGKAILGLMEKAGYQVLALGNHEFDKGPGVLAEALDSIAFPALCSDLEVQGTILKKSCQPFLLREYQGVRIGFFSLMTEDLPLITVTGDITVRKNQKAAARDMVRFLKNKGAQVIIAVTHIGISVDRKIAAHVPGIDIIFGGHSHKYLDTMQRVNNTLIVNGGEKGPAVVRLDVSLNQQGGLLPDSAVYSLIPVTNSIKPTPEIESCLATFRKQLPAVEIIGRTGKTWILSDALLRSRESGVADMITDMIRSRFNVDIVCYNSGAFRGDTEYPPGPITTTMLSSIDAFQSTVYLLTIQGKYIREILEHSAALIGTGGFLQVSGIRFSLDLTGQVQEISSNTGKKSCILRSGKRIKNIRIQSSDGCWQPLDPDHAYRLAANDFLVNRNGDGYFWFNQYGRDIHTTYTTMADVIRNFLERNKLADPPEPDGRISVR